MGREGSRSADLEVSAATKVLIFEEKASLANLDKVSPRMFPATQAYTPSSSALTNVRGFNALSICVVLSRNFKLLPDCVLLQREGFEKPEVREKE